MSERCPTEELLSCFHDGELNDEQSGIVSQHVESCSSCREIVRRYGELDECLSDEQFYSKQVGSSRYQRRWLLALAACFVVVALSFVLSESPSKVRTYKFAAKEEYLVTVHGNVRLVSLQMGDIKTTYEPNMEE